MRRSREQWLVLFQQQEESSLSVVEFCQLRNAHGITCSTTTQDI